MGPCPQCDRSRSRSSNHGRSHRISRDKSESQSRARPRRNRSDSRTRHCGFREKQSCSLVQSLSPHQTSDVDTPGGVFQTTPGRAHSSVYPPPLECSFCDSQQHLIPDCAVAMLYIEEELVTLSPYGELLLPDGRLLICESSGPSMQYQVNSYWTTLLLEFSKENSRSCTKIPSYRTRSPSETSHERPRHRSVTRTNN